VTSTLAEPAPASSRLRLLGAAALMGVVAYGLALFGAFQYAPAPVVVDGVRRALTEPGLADLLDLLVVTLPLTVALFTVVTLAGRPRRGWGEAVVAAAGALWPLALVPLTLWFDDPAGRQILAASLAGLAAWRAWPALTAGADGPPLARLSERAATLWSARPDLRAGVLCLLGTAFLFYGAWARHHAQWSSLIDLGLFYEQFDNAQGELLFAPTLGQSFLGEHFSPSLALLWPVMKLFPSPVTLLAIQSLAIGAGAHLLYRIGRERLGSPSLSALLMVAYLLSPYVQAAAFYDFHMDMLEPPMLFGLVLALYRKRALWVWVCAALLWTTKEDTFIYTSVLGVYAALALKQRRLGAALVVVGLAQAAVVLFAVLPALRHPHDPAFFSTTGPQEGYAFLMRYSHLGTSVPSMVGTLVGNPLYILDHLTTGARLTNLLALFLTFGGFALFSGWRLVLLAPALEMLLGDPGGPLSNFAFYYGAVAFMFAPLAAIEGARRLLDRPPRWLGVVSGPRLAALLGTLTVLVLVWHPTSWLSGEHTYKPTLHTAHQARAEVMMAAIPEGAAVSATGYLAVHLQPGRDVRMFPYGVDEADHVLIDLQRPAWPRSYPQVGAELLRMPSRGFTLVDHGDGLFRVERRPPDDPRAARAEIRSLLDHVVLEAELSEQTAFMSGVEADEGASNGAFRRVSPAARKGPGFLQYGPFASLDRGRYRVTYRLRWRPSGVIARASERLVATLDATVERGRNILDKRDLRVADLMGSAGAWQEHTLDLSLERRVGDLEVRVFYHGVGTLDLDVIRVDPVEDSP